MIRSPSYLVFVIYEAQLEHDLSIVIYCCPIKVRKGTKGAQSLN